MRARTPTLSLIVPTRGRPRQLRRFLRSLAATTARPSRVEVVLVVDADDTASHAVRYPGLRVRVVVGPPGGRWANSTGPARPRPGASG